MRATLLPQTLDLISENGLRTHDPSDFTVPVLTLLGSANAIEPAGENLVVNPSFGLSASDWIPTSSASISRVVDSGVHGDSHGSCTASGLQAGCFTLFEATIGLPYTVSAWVNAPSGRSITIRLEENAGSKSWIATTTEVQDGEWRRMSAAGVATQTTMRLRVDVGADDSGFTFLLDGAQAEQGAWASSYIDGSRGEGYAWTGTAHASTSTREAGRLRVGAAWLDPWRGGVAAFVRPYWGAAEASEHVVFHRQTAAGDELRLAFEDGDWLLSSTRGAAESSVTVPASHQGGEDALVTAGWTPRSLVLDVGGVRASAPRAGGAPDLRSARQLEVGRRQDEASGWLDGALGPLVFFKEPLQPRPVEVLRRLRRAPRWGESYGSGVPVGLV